jgi:replicative DNA helicase
MMATIKIKNEELSDNSAPPYVISSLMHKPLLIEDERFLLTQEDFSQPLQQIIFTTIFNMAKQGFASITPPDIDLFLKQYESQYNYYTANKGYEWLLNIQKISEGFNESEFKYYYDRLKKFSILRDLNSHGFDVRPFYDPTKEFLLHDEEDKKLNQLKLSEIPNRIRELLVDIENRHVGKETQTSITSEEGLRKLVSDLKATPEVGLPIDGEILNYALRGARLGKLYVYSAPSGAGKTRFLVGNACAISLPYIENGKIIKREHLKPVLFIATEMGADEIQTLIISYVSGVNEEKILLGSYSAEEEARIRLALDILDKYGKNFIIESMPDPSMAMIRAKMAKYIIQDEVEYIFYDYIFSSPGLLSEFRDLEVREDVALMMLSNTLKEVATTYQVFVQTATQLNGNWEKISTRNANLIRGSKAIADKIDIGIIGVRLDQEEMEKVEILLNELKLKTPNIVMDIYKNRRGKLTSMKIFRYFDYGTCRAEDILITDSNYKIVQDVGKLTYEKRAFDYLDVLTMDGGTKDEQ